MPVSIVLERITRAVPRQETIDFRLGTFKQGSKTLQMKPVETKPLVARTYAVRPVGKIPRGLYISGVFIPTSPFPVHLVPLILPHPPFYFTPCSSLTLTYSGHSSVSETLILQGTCKSLCLFPQAARKL